MKTAIYVEDGIVQLVITPEGEFEQDALSTLHGKEIDASIFTGQFYDCRGGWIRQREYENNISYTSLSDSMADKSLILVARTMDEGAS